MIYTWASTQQNLSLGSPTRQHSNQSPQLQRLARKLKIRWKQGRCGTFQKANNKGADQTAHMRRLVSTCVVRKHRRQVFSRRGPDNIMPHFHSYEEIYHEIYHLPQSWLALVGLNCANNCKCSKISNTSYLPKVLSQTVQTQIRQKKSCQGIPCLLL